jgi:hypothetical protein
MSQKAVRSMALSQNGSHAAMVIEFAKPDQAERFVAAQGKRAMGAVRRRIESIARGAPDRSRQRSGELQPQLPTQLRERLSALATEERTTSSRIIRKWLNPYIDFETGDRRKNKTTEEFRLPRPLSAFQKRGEQLHATSDLTRLTFDAGNRANKKAINGLTARTHMNISEFFTALIDLGLEQRPARRSDS